MNTDQLCELGKGEPSLYSQPTDSPVYGAIQQLPLRDHASVLDQRSIFSKHQQTARLFLDRGHLLPMGDARHKRSPPKVQPQKVTELFVKQVIAALAANDAYNAQHKLRKGDRGYKPSSHQDLSDATGADPNQIKNMLGGVRAGTKTKAIGRSKYVDPICELLGIKRMVGIEVPIDLVDLVQRIANLSDEERAALEAEIKRK